MGFRRRQERKVIAAVGNGGAENSKGYPQPHEGKVGAKDEWTG